MPDVIRKPEPGEIFKIDVSALSEEQLKQEYEPKEILCQSIDSAWLFKKIGKSENEILSEVCVNCKEEDYETVDIPHTWNLEDGADGWKKTDEDGNSYYRGNGIYRKNILLDSAVWQGKHIYLSFEGANTVTTVFINGQEIGSHEGGYSAFRFDITKYIELDQKNVVAVLVNNSRTTDIAPLDQEGDFTKFGGIYRNVSIFGVEDMSFDHLKNGTDNVAITPVLSDDYRNGTIKINVVLRNTSSKLQEVELISIVKDADGAEKTRYGVKAAVPGNGGNVYYEFVMSDIHRWNGTKNPYLYSVETSLLQDGEVLETNVSQIGFRTYDVKGNTFYLNGEKYNLHGVNYHQDSDKSGWAMTDAEREDDYNMMKEMGVNAVRMAHYQHDAYEYELCDRMGFIVYTEIPLINRTKEDTFTVDWARFSNNIKQQLVELITQNYNHPSIFFWGISNELYDVDEETSTLYTELCELAHLKDSTRKTIYADNQAYESYVKRSQSADLVGYNRYDGWYYSKLGAACSWVQDRIDADGRPACLSEYGAGGAVSQHMDQPAMKDITANGKEHCEEYQAVYHEEEWADIVKTNNIWGSFIWCMFDFASDTREEGDTLGQNDKGLVTRDRQKKKDAFYFYQSVWSAEPMVHITSSRYQNRPANVPEIKVYSNAEKVELFVNDQPLGEMTADTESGKTTIYRYKNAVLAENAENKVTVVAIFPDGNEKIETICWKTKGKQRTF